MGRTRGGKKERTRDLPGMENTARDLQKKKESSRGAPRRKGTEENGRRMGSQSAFPKQEKDVFFGRPEGTVRAVIPKVGKVN